MFDWEHGIALHTVPGIRALTPAEGGDSWDFSSCSRNLGYILDLQRGWTYETPLGSAKSTFLSSYDGHLRKLNKFGRIIQTLLEVRWETIRPFLVSTEILGFLSIFKMNQASGPFEILNSVGFSKCQVM